MEEAEAMKLPSKPLKVVCSLYPEIFNEDKSICKNYFRQYGKVMRLIFKPKKREIVVEYTNENDYLNALSGPSEYDGQSFKVEPYEPIIRPPQIQIEGAPTKKHHREKITKKHKIAYLNPEQLLNKKHNVSYIDNNEVNEELAAMGRYAASNKIIDLTEDLPQLHQRSQRVPKLNRVWRKKEVTTEPPILVPEKKKIGQTLAKKKVIEQLKILTAEQLELLKTIKAQAQTVDEKYKVLDARDKLLRSINKKPRLKSSPTIGTCLDMCPEKERLLREIQHQVSIYEQDKAGRHCMDHSKAVKQYSRSSADQEAPLPHELRSVNVLQMTMTYLMYNIMPQDDLAGGNNMMGEWYHFLWDRTRGIRKDMTQQALCCQGSVELVQQCARFHIHCSARFMGEDPSIFDQKINTENLTKCLQTLKYMYHDLEVKGEKCLNEAEFRAYIILLNLSDGNFMWEVQELRKEIKKSPEVRFALQIYSAFEKRNYVKFFKLIKSTTYLNACILMRYFVQVRVQAIETLVKCFTPPKSFSYYPVQELTEMLLFDDAESTIDFMKSYGINVSTDRINFMLDRSCFMPEEYSYILDRSKLVEQKRMSSLGDIVNGKEISPEMYMQMQSHEVHNSFDKNGYLIQDEMFKEIELSIENKLLEDEADSRESTPERNSIVANIFAQKSATSNVTLRKHQKEEQNIFNKPSNIFSQPKPDPSNIFTKTETTNIFAQKVHSQQETNIFAKNIFTAKDEVDNVFAKPNIFSDSVQIQRDPKLNEKNIFAVKEPLDVSKKGGFHFDLNRPQTTKMVPNIFVSELNLVDVGNEENELKKLEQERSRLQEEIKREIEREEEEIRRKNEEAAEKRRLEAERIKQEEIERKKREELERIEKEKRLEQEKIKLAERMQEEKQCQAEARKREEDMKRRQEELEQKRKEEKRQNLEIEITVKLVVNKIVDTVDLKLREETLTKIRENIKRRFLTKICKKWRSVTVKRVKKRKAMDCNPAFVHSKSVTQCAKELQAKSQDLALSNMKRYKSGRPLDIPLIPEQKISQINMFLLTYSSLRRRLCELKEKWHQHIYWKVVISLPDINEMIQGLHNLEQTLKKYINWQLNKYGNTVYIEEHKTVTYCVEKQQGFNIQSFDANGFIFIGKNFDEIMQRRVFETLKDFGVFVKLPLVLILEDTQNSEEYFRNLKATGVVTDFVIYSCNLNSQILPSIIDNGLLFLSKLVEKYPPLEMDTLEGFLNKNLCTEMWKKAGSYAKWNHDYNICMADPNIVINLYNEGLKMLEKIITNDKLREYATFPEIFKNYLPDKVPDFLPCDYRYFPDFTLNPLYYEHLKSVINDLRLPKFLEKWPPNNEEDLLISLSKYCAELFKNPKEPLIALLNTLKNFDKAIWTEAIQIIALAKIREQNLSLPQKFHSDIFINYMVVYDVNIMNEYSSSEWFYRNNPIIEGYKKIFSKKIEYEQEKNKIKPKKRALDLSMNPEDVLNVINKAENVLRSPKNICLEAKNQLDNLNRNLKDLEDSINVVKQMDDIRLLKRFIEN